MKYFYSKKTSSILIHILIWIIFFGLSILPIYFRIGLIPLDFLYIWAILIFVFYLNYYVLVTKLLLNKKVLLYIVVALVLSLSFTIIIREFIPVPERFPDREGFMSQFSELQRSSPIRSNGMPVFRFGPKFIFPTIGIILLILTLSTSVRLAIEWYKTERKRAIVESQKKSSELSFLKAQLNPHFLFNSLNSVYSLANKKSDDTAVAIVTLSELMRYMIYEANDETVSLEKEIEHIKNYISLQLLRLKDSSGVVVNIHGDLNYKIEPLLLISFIENAFKYGTDFTGKTTIKIKITIKDEELTLNVFNTVSYRKKNNENSGIGLENIKNRLDLLYPNAHTLGIKADKKTHEVNLILKLKSDK